MPATRQDAPPELLEFIRSGYALWNAGELESVAEMWSEAIVWQNDPAWPGQTTYHGRERVIAFLREEVAEVIELGDIEVESIQAFGDELVIKLLARTRGADSHLDIGKVPVFHVAKLRDGKVVRIRAYLDEGRALAAAARRRGLSAADPAQHRAAGRGARGQLGDAAALGRGGLAHAGAGARGGGAARDWGRRSCSPPAPLAALPAGRSMDRFGRIPVLATGYVVGMAGCGLAALGSATESAPGVLAGLICVGAASGVALLARTAAGDMYPPERRARGIAFVLFGAVFGAILGPRCSARCWPAATSTATRSPRSGWPRAAS